MTCAAACSKTRWPPRPQGRPALRDPPAAAATWAHLSERGWERLRDGLAAGDPDGEVAAVWLARELLVEVYGAVDLAHARRRLIVFRQHAADADVPELNRLARTIDAWRGEILASTPPPAPATDPPKPSPTARTAPARAISATRRRCARRPALRTGRPRRRPPTRHRPREHQDLHGPRPTALLPA